MDFVVFPIEQGTQREEPSAKIKSKVCRMTSKAGNKVCQTRFANPGAEEEINRQAVGQGQKQGLSNNVVQVPSKEVRQTRKEENRGKLPRPSAYAQAQCLSPERVPKIGVAGTARTANTVRGRSVRIRGRSVRIRGRSVRIRGNL